MKKTVALLLTLILLFALSISALAYADGPTPEGGESQSGPQPEPAPVQPSGSGTGDALRFSESVLNAPAFGRIAGGTGTCDLGNGKMIYTFLTETLKDWKGLWGVNTVRFLVNGAVYEISLADLLESLNKSGADSVHIKLDEDGLHLYAKPKEFGGVKRVDIATLQPAGDQSATNQPATDQPAADQPAADQPAADQPAGDQSSAVQPAAQVDTAMQAKEGTGTAKAEQERKMQFDPFTEKTNRFDENGRPLYTYEKKDDGTMVVTEYTYEDDGSHTERTMTFTSFTYNTDGTIVRYYDLKGSEGYIGRGKIEYNKDGQPVREVYDYKLLDNGDMYHITKYYNKEGKLYYVEKQKNGRLIS